MITALALAIIGLLALFQIPGLSSISSYWYVFGLGAFFSFAAGLVCCCRSLCVSHKQLPASGYNEPQQENLEAPESSSYQTNLSYPANHYIRSPAQEPKTTPEKFFIQARECVQGKEKDKKNYQRAVLLYKKAMKLGHIPSIFYLGKCHLKGKGTKEDRAKAISLFQDAAEKGNVESMYTLVLLDMEQDKIDEAIARLQKIPDKDTPFKDVIDTFLSNPQTDHTITLLKKTIECAANNIKVKKKLERSITWNYV